MEIPSIFLALLFGSNKLTYKIPSKKQPSSPGLYYMTTIWLINWQNIPYFEDDNQSWKHHNMWNTWVGAKRWPSFVDAYFFFVKCWMYSKKYDQRTTNNSLWLQNQISGGMALLMGTSGCAPCFFLLLYRRSPIKCCLKMAAMPNELTGGETPKPRKLIICSALLVYAVYKTSLHKTPYPWAGCSPVLHSNCRMNISTGFLDIFLIFFINGFFPSYIPNSAPWAVGDRSPPVGRGVRGAARGTPPQGTSYYWRLDRRIVGLGIQFIGFFNVYSRNSNQQKHREYKRKI